MKGLDGVVGGSSPYVDKEKKKKHLPIKKMNKRVKGLSKFDTCLVIEEVQES